MLTLNRIHPAEDYWQNKGYSIPGTERDAGTKPNIREENPLEQSSLFTLSCHLRNVSKSPPPSMAMPFGGLISPASTNKARPNPPAAEGPKQRFRPCTEPSHAPPLSFPPPPRGDGAGVRIRFVTCRRCHSSHGKRGAARSRKSPFVSGQPSPQCGGVRLRGCPTIYSY